MAAGLEVLQKRRITAKGLHAFSADEALAGMQAMPEGEPQVVALKADWAHFVRELPDGIGRSFLAEIVDRREPSPPPPAPARADGLRGRLGRLPKSERRDFLADAIEDLARTTLGLAPGRRIARHHSLHDLGLDSLMAVELRNNLSRQLDCPLTPTLLFDYPTIDALVGHIGVHVFEGQAEPAVRRATPASVNGAPDDDLAAIEAMPEAEAEALLMDELKRLGGD
jgi:acyl carrier protein